MDRPTDRGQDFLAGTAASREAFVAALRLGDAAAAAAFYTRDARLLAPSAELLIGRTDIARFWQAGMDAGVRGIELYSEQAELEAGGAVGFEVGRYVVRVRPVDGPEIVDRGKYAVLHRREHDGTWRRALEMLTPDGDPR
jgi:ketosteroid isomerase-like protein